MMLVRRASTASAGSLVAGVVNSLTLVLAMNDGRAVEVGTYLLGTAWVALVGVGLAGGSTLLYLSGDDAERIAVARARLRLVTPALVAAAVLTAVLLGPADYPSLQVLAAGAAGVLVNQTELTNAGHQRRLEPGWVAGPLVASRLLALALVAVGVPVAVAFLAAAMLAWGLALSHRGRESWLVEAVRPTDGRTGVGSGWTGTQRPLLLLAWADALVNRAPLVLLSFFVGAAAVGRFGAVLAVVQAVAGVLLGALYVSMAARARSAGDVPARHADRLDRLVVWAGGAVGGLAAVSAPVWLPVLDVPTDPGRTWAALLALSLPFLCWTRVVQYRLVAARQRVKAAAVLAVPAVGVVVGVPLGAVLGGPTGAALAVLLAEVAGSLTTASPWVRSRQPEVQRAAG